VHGRRGLLFVLATAAFGQPVAPPITPPDAARIALRYGTGQVLIMGGDIDARDASTAKTLKAIRDKYPKLKTIGAIPEVNAIPAALLQTFNPEPRTGWRIGDQWQLYTAAGPPLIMAIETIVILNHPICDCYRDGAIARFLTPAAANLSGALRANEFIVAPGAGLASVSQEPLIPSSPFEPLDEEGAIRKVLFLRAREILKDENWNVSENQNGSLKDQQRVRDWNRQFLDATDDNIRITVQSWSPPGRKRLFFVVARWVAAIAEKETPVFVAEAVFEAGPELNLLAFEYSESERMRMSEFTTWTWNYESMCTFQNAYKIGDRYFVLRRIVGYESDGIELQELVAKKGLVSTTLGWAF